MAEEEDAKEPTGDSGAQASSSKESSWTKAGSSLLTGVSGAQSSSSVEPSWKVPEVLAQSALRAPWLPSPYW